MEVKLTRITNETTSEYEEGTNNFKVKDNIMIDLVDKIVLSTTESDITTKIEDNKTVYKDEGIWKHGYDTLDDAQEYKYSYTKITDEKTGETRTIRFDEEADENQIGENKIKESTYDTVTDEYDNIISRIETTKYEDGTISSRKKEIKTSEEDVNIKVKTISCDSDDEYVTTNYDLSDNKDKAILKITNENINDKNKSCFELSYEADGQQIIVEDGQIGMFKQIIDTKNNLLATIQYEPVALYLDQFDSNDNKLMYEKYDKTPDGFKLTLSEKYENILDEQNRVIKTIGRELIDTNKKPEDWYQGINSTNSSLYEIYKDKLL